MTHKQITAVMVGLMTGLLLAALDQSIVSTALKTITVDLGGLNHYTWVVTAYLLTSTASTPLYGKISDLYGRRQVFQFAIIVFLIGSFAAGAAHSMNQLIISRAFQGLGAFKGSWIYWMALDFLHQSSIWNYRARRNICCSTYS
jgi:MFS family permease